MTFYSPSDSKFTRHYREEVEMVFSGIDCVLNDEKGIYCSSELTTGTRLYDMLRKYGVRTASELKSLMGQAWFEQNIFAVNVQTAKDFARRVRRDLTDNTMVITPAPFSAPGWSQPEYLAFWETLIRTRIQVVWFNRNWEFSNGCTFDLVVAQDAGVPTFRHDGQVLDRTSAIDCLLSAIERLETAGFDTAKLQENLEKLQLTRVPMG